uniref:U5 small nuclear ribonucleoprotein TSSC4 n=2 Tax=Iconisemion striatum TaxID=60296 RepID=A0A1A7YUW9_9TELE
MSDQERVGDNGGMFKSNDVLELSASDESEVEKAPSRAPFDPDDDDDDGEVEVEASGLAPTVTFTLTGGNSAFSYRSRSIFDCLDTVDRKTVSSLNQESATNSRKTTSPMITCPTPPKKRGVPDYVAHPERWTHYSLEDVTESSDQENRRTAHQFLSSLRQQTNPNPPCDIQKRMIFSRPNRPAKDHINVQQGKETGLQLSHLAEEEEEDEGKRREETRGQIILENEQKEDEEEVVGGGVEPAEEKMMDESNLGFTSFRKTKTKNYRRSSEHDDDE